MNDFEIIKEKMGNIAPKSAIPNSLTKDKYPYYLDKPYLNEYGSLPSNDLGLKKPLTFDILSDGTINWVHNQYGGNHNFRVIEYSKNGGEWITIGGGDGAMPIEIQVVTGDVLQFRGNNKHYSHLGVRDEFDSDVFGGTALFDLSGNIMSMIDSENYDTITELPECDDPNDVYYKWYTFAWMFRETNVVNAKDLILPATTLIPGCYSNMFYSCDQLITAPKLPATTLAEKCYESMFTYTSLTTAPELPAATLEARSYYEMFAGCNALNYVKCLAIDISEDACTQDWLSYVSSNGTFVKDADMNGWEIGGEIGIPTSWTVTNA